MGVVFAATHMQLEQQVAIKFLLGSTVSDDMRSRFALESKVMGKIRNRHVVQVLDVGSVDDGIPYIVMEHLAGEDLLRVSRRGGLTIGNAISYLVEACEGLAAAHAVGVIHRDIKPSNLFLANEPDGTCSVKVIDFGVAKFRGVDTNPDAGEGPLTQTATVIGSPRYMSPEQAIDSRGVDARTDVWALGVILHELLVGKPLFKAASFAEVLVSVLSKPIAHPSDVSPQIPRGLGDAVLRALSRDRDTRTSSPLQFAREIAVFARSLENEALGDMRLAAVSSASHHGIGVPPSSAAACFDTLAQPQWGLLQAGSVEVSIVATVAAEMDKRPRKRWPVKFGLPLCIAVASAFALFARFTHVARTTNAAAVSPAKPEATLGATVEPSTAARTERTEKTERMLEVHVTVPPGASVMVDGRPDVVTNGTVRLQGTLGHTHHLKATLQGRTVEADIAISENGPIPPAIFMPPPMAAGGPQDVRAGARQVKAPSTLPRVESASTKNPDLARSFE